MLTFIRITETTTYITMQKMHQNQSSS